MIDARMEVKLNHTGPYPYASVGVGVCVGGGEGGGEGLRTHHTSINERQTKTCRYHLKTKKV